MQLNKFAVRSRIVIISFQLSIDVNFMVKPDHNSQNIGNILTFFFVIYLSIIDI